MQGITDAIVRVDSLGADKNVTLHESVKALCEEYPTQKSHFLYDSGDIKDHFIFAANCNVVASQSPITDASNIEVIIAASGGAGRPNESTYSETG